jgi:2,3,4,5-tetrahydropyridine-2-carboxylate N-succinyltransferase|tara:strand:- start:2317 stop:3231 length:915 start_codon:yes stop_codon:yes gene_type:complete
MKIYGEGVANKSKSGQILDVYFPNIEFANKKTDAKNIDVLSDSQELIKLDWSEVDLKNPIEKVSDAYFKLHLISNKFVLPNTINLDGLFECLPNVAWTNIGPISIEEIEERLNKSKLEGDNFFIRSLDKFPCLTDYVIPKKVRVADTSRVRLGAYLSEGTTVMHEGFINFNAGTLGKAMIEGRISAGVVIGDNSDLGGGSSTMGTLSGGNNTKISIGKNCLLGANSGIGISLGDDCTVEAGLYITSGTKVNIINEDNNKENIVKAIELSGKSNLLYMRDSLSGKVVAKINKSKSQLNKILHEND